MSDPIPMELLGVRIELPANQPIVLLREREGRRHLAIFIGAVEATAIAYALEGVVPQRPMTHDLLRDLTLALGGEVTQVVVTELRNNIFFADLVLQRTGEEVRISSRPSDAIALAVRTGAEIYASNTVLEDAGIEMREEDDEEEIERFREFLEDISPEDFSETS